MSASLHRRPRWAFVAKLHAANGECSATQPTAVQETDDEVSGTVFFVHGSSVGLSDYGVLGVTNAHCVEKCSRHVCRVMQEDHVIAQAPGLAQHLP